MRVQMSMQLRNHDGGPTLEKAPKKERIEASSEVEAEAVER